MIGYSRQGLYNKKLKIKHQGTKKKEQPIDMINIVLLLLLVIVIVLFIIS